MPRLAAGQAAAAQLLARIRADRRAGRWVPAFERDWGKALEDSRHSYRLARCMTSSANGRSASTPPRPWTPSSTPAWTTATSSPRRRPRVSPLVCSAD
nr:DUF6247 family protein [Streptomyces ochraceiscleroticus]